MKISARFLIFLIICTLSTQGVKAENTNNSNTGQGSAVAIELTKFDVNDTTLELSYKIKNNTDHVVWICDSVSTHSKSERYLAEDAQTLVIRKRLDISPELAWSAAPLGQYVRLQPAQEYSESLLCALPVRPALTYIGERANAESAKRIVLEIGFYDQDLPGLIRSIIGVVERLGCANVEYENYESDIMRHYFKGLLIKNRFGGLEHFDEYHPADSEQFITAYTDQLLGEQVLRLEVDNVLIPYEDDYPPLANQDVNEPADSQDVEESAVSMELTHFEITDANLELGWNIKNNSDHDVWVCDRIIPGYSFERFLDTDKETLIIRKRFNLPQGRGWEHLPKGYYVRLCSGQEAVDSISLSVPIKPYIHFNPLLGNAEYVRRVALEVGFYDEDLPGMILEIVDLAERLGCDISPSSPIWDYRNDEVSHRFFGGVFIARAFYLEAFKYFSNSITSGGDEVILPYMWQALKGEQVLRLEVDEVHIPYED